MTHVAVIEVSGDGAPGAGPCLMWRFGQLAWRTRYAPAAPERAQGVAMRLQDGAVVLAEREAICSTYADARDRAEAAAQQVTPWASAITAAVEADRLDRHADRVGREAGQSELWHAMHERWNDNGALEQAQTYLQAIQHVATDDESATHPTATALAPVVQARLRQTADVCRRQALAAAPDLTAHPAPGAAWSVPAPYTPPQYIGAADEDQEELPTLLTVQLLRAWALDKPAVNRDSLIRWAERSGVAKSDIHRLTGVARTTIDRILKP
ncbi:hypothetical protein [Streptomyces microflavus]|uniref:hypothetical protein n=1 Tax=Streptomyces microflavus TaxID=1919 RepID=UPI00339FA31D